MGTFRTAQAKRHRRRQSAQLTDHTRRPFRLPSFPWFPNCFRFSHRFLLERLALLPPETRKDGGRNQFYEKMRETGIGVL